MRKQKLLSALVLLFMAITSAWAQQSAVITEAEALAADNEAVAVGKLKAALETAKANESAENIAALQAAIDQFKEDNADQEKDETAKVGTEQSRWTGATGVVPNWAGDAVTTYDGRTVAMVENFNGGSGAVTGEIFSQTITGLSTGEYKVAFYANANSTADRDSNVETGMADGASDVAYVFANDVQEFLVAHRATALNTYGNGEYSFEMTLTEADNGTIKLGLGKAKAGTNWHTMQIKQLTWFTTAKEVYAADKVEMQNVINQANAVLDDEDRINGRDIFSAAIATATADMSSNMYNISEFETRIAILKSAINDFIKINKYIISGAYYIIDAETGNLMAAGNNYGTHGIVNNMGLDLTLTPNEETRTVTIDSRVFSSNDNHFLGSNLYMDSSAYGWALEKYGDGYKILNPTTGQYINIDGNNLVMSDTPRKFIFTPKEDFIAARKSALASATQETPMDATFLLQNPNFNRNDRRVEAWTIEANNQNLNGGNGENNCAESFQSTFTLSQTIENAPKGVYRLTAQGFYRQDGSDNENLPYFYINDQKSTFPLKTGSENSMSDASVSFTNGLYAADPIYIELPTDGTLTVGAKLENNTALWCIWDNFELTYYGPEASLADILFAEKIAQVATLRAQANEQKSAHPYAPAGAVEALNNTLAETAEIASSEAAYNEAISALQTAISNFKLAIRYIDFDGEYYINEATNGKLMAAGHNYGTRGIVNNAGLDLTLTPNAETRTVTIDSRVGGNNHFLGSNLYMDSSAYGWALEKYGDGYKILNPTTGQYINIDGNNLVMSDTPRKFIFTPKEDFIAARKSALASATQETPMDATFLLQNPNFNRDDQRVEAWEWNPTSTEENNTLWNNHNFNGGNQTNNCAESYHASFIVQQAISGAPAGIYKLTAQGFYRQDDNVEEDAPVFFIGDQTVKVPVKTGEENSMSAASESFTNGLYTIEPIEFEFDGEGNLVVGVTATAIHQWVIFDNFQLTYYGLPELTLNEEVDNTATLKENNGKKANVTLTRTLRTGSYNTFAVPFNIDAIPTGWTVKELTSSSLDNKGTLSLEFENATSIEAGKPYLVKVTNEVANPTFEGVTISSTTTPTETDAVNFIPTVGKTTLSADENDPENFLFIGEGNKLYNPSSLPQDIKGFRAYFYVKNIGTGSAKVRTFNLDFGDGETTGIIELRSEEAGANGEGFYDLMGRSIQGQPTQKGVYIKNGKKVIVK